MTATPAPLPRRSWGRIALVAALVLSLFLNAVVLGAWLRWREVRDDLLGPEASAATLPDDLRQDLRRALRTNADTIRPLLRDVVQKRAAIIAAAEARPYVRADTEAAMAAFRTSVDTLLQATQGVFLDRLDARAAAP